MHPSAQKVANAATVKKATGFSIGGVPPFGHDTQLAVYIDKDLTHFDVVWAAAGTPFAVFAIAPDDLVRAIDVKENVLAVGANPCGRPLEGDHKGSPLPKIII